MALQHNPTLYNQSKDQILENMRNFREGLGNPLTAIWFHVAAPPLLDTREAPLSCRETPQEREALRSSFFLQVRTLFEALNDARDSKVTFADQQQRWVNTDTLLLHLKFLSQSFKWSDRYPSCFHRHYDPHWLSLRDAAALPSVSNVTNLCITFEYSGASDVDSARAHPLALQVPFELATHLSSLRELECRILMERMPIAFQAKPLRQYTRIWAGPWRDTRHDLLRVVRQLKGQLPTTFKKACIWFWIPGYPNEDQSTPMPNLVHPAENDPLSLGLSIVASQLEELGLRAIVTPDLFDARTPWTRMKRLSIEFHPWRPDGSWYFVGPRGEDPNEEGYKIQESHYPPLVTTQEDREIDDEWRNWPNSVHDEVHELQGDMFRIEPLPERAEPLLKAFAAALKMMPHLEEAELFTFLHWYPSEDRELKYAGETHFEKGVHRWGVTYTAIRVGSRALLEFQMGDWRPSSDIVQTFEELGRGGDMEIAWKPFEITEDRGDDIFPDL